MQALRVLTVSTKGIGTNEDLRIRTLLENFTPEAFPYDPKMKLRSFRLLLARLARERPSLVCVEGTGIAAGLAVLLGSALFKIPYVISSGDAVGPFVASQSRIFGPAFALYERALCHCAAGFIGWTPYLAGRALTFGVRRAITAAGWAPREISEGELLQARREIRAHHGIPENAIVVGVAGSLAFAKRAKYCYGLDVVQALSRVRRPDIHGLIVGGGSGMAKLEVLAGPRLNRTIHIPGPVAYDDVFRYLAAMDLGMLSQSVDGVGSFRYTTKLSEYLAVGLPVVTSQIPIAYDIPGDWLWRLPGDAPWKSQFIDALANLLQTIDHEAIRRKREAVPRHHEFFDRSAQVARVTAFVHDLIEDQT
jgi:hypothetical protein